ncbi:MAG: hypothetical protein ACPHM2_05370 [Alcanivorax sp.]
MLLHFASFVEHCPAGLFHAQTDRHKLIQFSINQLQALAAGTLEVFLVAQQARDLVRLFLVEEQFDAFLATGLVAGTNGFGQPAELGLFFPGQLSLFLFQFCL